MLPRQTSTRINALWLAAPLLSLVSCIGETAIAGNAAGAGAFQTSDLGNPEVYWDCTINLVADPEAMELILEFSPDGTELINVHNNDGVGSEPSLREIVDSFGGIWESTCSVSSDGTVIAELGYSLSVEGVDYASDQVFTGTMDSSKNLIEGDFFSQLSASDGTLAEDNGPAIAIRSDGSGFSGD